MNSPATTTQILQSIPWFLDLKPEQIDRLLSTVTVRHLDTGEMLFREGDREDCLYLLIDGQVDICSLVPTRGMVHILTAEPLDIIGWSSLTPVVRQRTASAQALKPARLLAFEGEGLRRVCEEDHELGYVIFRRLSNVIASRLLVTRLHLLDMIVQTSAEHKPDPIHA